MGDPPTPGRFLWYVRIPAWQQEPDLIEQNTSSINSRTVLLATSLSKQLQEKRFVSVDICCVPSQHADRRNGSYSQGKCVDQLCSRLCTKVSVYEDAVAVVTGNHVYSSSAIFRGHELRKHSNDTHLAKYIRLALNDAEHGHTSQLREVPAISRLTCFPATVVSVACGAQHLLLCTSVGRLYTMGSNHHGQLGRGIQSTGFVGLGDVSLETDACKGTRKHKGHRTLAAVEVYAGSSFSFAIARCHSTWKQNYDLSPFECRKRTADRNVEKVRSGFVSNHDDSFLFAATKGMERSACGTSHTKRISHSGAEAAAHSPCADNRECAIEDQSLGFGKGDVLYSWGWNEYGQLGHGTIESTSQPVEVKKPYGVISWNSVAAGFAHVAILTGLNTVYSCGLNLHGQLGLGTTRKETSPRKVDIPEPIKQVSCGTWHTLFLTSRGHLLTAGRAPVFPYTSWLQPAGSTLQAYTVSPTHLQAGLKNRGHSKKVSPAASSEAFEEHPHSLVSSSDATSEQISGQAHTLEFRVGAGVPALRAAAFLRCDHRVTLSTTDHLRRFCDGTGKMVKLKSYKTSDNRGTQPGEDAPFAHASGILRVKGFCDRLVCISAGQTASAAVGLDARTRRHRLYVWKASEPPGSPAPLFGGEVYDIGTLVKTVEDADKTQVWCHCAAAGVYVWTESRKACPSVCSVGKVL